MGLTQISENKLEHNSTTINFDIKEKEKLSKKYLKNQRYIDALRHEALGKW